MAGIDDGVAQGGCVGSDVGEEVARDGRLAGRFDAMQGEVSTGCGMGLESLGQYGYFITAFRH